MDSALMSKAKTSENAIRGRSTPSSVKRGGNGGGGPITLPLMRWSAFSCMATKAPRRPHPASPWECAMRSEEHTSELQSRPHLVCRLLLEKKKINTIRIIHSNLARDLHCRS